VPRNGPRYSEDEARRAIAASYSWAESLRRLGMCRSGNAWKILKKYAAIWDISTEHFDPHRDHRGPIPRQARPIETILVEGSSYNRGHLKNRLFGEGLKARRCELCGQGEEWQGRKMSLDTHCGRADRLERVRECEVCGIEFEARFASQQFCSQSQVACCGVARARRW
jgi:hypothetical protein